MDGRPIAGGEEWLTRKATSLFLATSSFHKEWISLPRRACSPLNHLVSPPAEEGTSSTRIRKHFDRTAHQPSHILESLRKDPSIISFHFFTKYLQPNLGILKSLCPRSVSISS
ncbi:hypothetical protein QVD17_02538 [Tagetes erecta]|uniref:Uncharacterized protein n=1 Tax=Tagetes erecta TaxID=13708 RepID=A0AAD8P992_TARER|nr:hypothetical protein QVD17_02538 [Tagetes erecta]